MRCPEIDELALWVDGALPEARARVVGLHVDECLPCRLIAGIAPDSVPATPDRNGDDCGFLPPFEVALPGIRRSYGQSSPEESFDVAFVGPADLRIAMAADTDGRPPAMSIPSVYAEDGRLVVTFRVDLDGRVTAFFVSEDVDRARFRALRIGEHWFLADNEGRVRLTTMAADEVLGKEVVVAPVLGAASIRREDIGDPGEQPVDLVASGGPGIAARILRRTAWDGPQPTLMLRSAPASRADAAAGENATLVVILDNREARIIRTSPDAESAISLPPELPGEIRIQIIDRF